MQNLLYIIWDVNPEIVNIGGFPLKYYGLLFCIGIILCYQILKSVYKNEGLSNQAHEALFFYGFFGILIGARLGHCLFYDFEYYKNHILEIFIPFQQDFEGNYHFIGYAGLASHGGGIGLILMLLIYSFKFKIKFLKVLDIVAIVTPLGGAFIRLANLMNSEMIGIPTTKPWAFVFLQIDNLPRHPAQLYEAISYFIIFFIVYFLYRKKIFSVGTGFYFGLIILLIFVMRFLIEFIKIEQVDFEQGMIINMGQILSIPFIIIGLFFVVKNILNKKTTHISTI